MTGRKHYEAPETMPPGLRHGEIAHEWAFARRSHRATVRQRMPRLAALLDAHATGLRYLDFDPAADRPAGDR